MASMDIFEGRGRRVGTTCFNMLSVASPSGVLVLSPHQPCAWLPKTRVSMECWQSCVGFDVWFTVFTYGEEGERGGVGWVRRGFNP